MRILFLHQHFHPETVGTSTRLVEIVDYLVENGHEVTVVTGIPSHPSTMANGEVSRNQPRLENFRGATVHRVWAFGSRRRDNFFRRMMTYGSFMVLGCLKALRVKGEFDVLVAVSPLPNGVAGWVVKRFRKIPLMFDVCDIWPDCAVAVGMLRGNLLIRVAQWLEKKVYHASRRIGVVTRGFTVNIAAKGIAREKVSLLPDWVDPALYDPAKQDRIAVRNEYEFGDKFVVSFLGNFGLIMGIEQILETARLLKDSHPDVLFLFVGKGVSLPMMEERIREWGLTNTRIIPYQPRDRVPGLLAASDALVVTYKKTNITLITVASKIYEYMSIARPIVAGVEGVIGEILTEAGCGIVSSARSPREMADAIIRLKESPELGDKMGLAGREYASKHFSFAKVAADYERTVAETAGVELPSVPPGAVTEAEAPPALTASIIIVNWNTRELLKRCVDSLLSANVEGGHEIIVVDNGSSDGSLELLQSTYPQVRLLFPGENLGFGGANNLGMRAARGRYLLILNSDTEVESDAVQRMCYVLEQRTDVGVVGAKLLNPDGSVQLSCRRFPSFKTALFNRYSLLTRLFPRNRYSSQYLMTEEGHEHALEPDWVSGACLMIRREVIDQVGGLDEDFFMYAEDVDWCYRIRRAGWRVVYEPSAHVLHHIGRSTKRRPYRMIFERHRSMWLFYRKHYSKGIVLVDAATWLGVSLRCSLLIFQAMIRSIGRREVRA